jgi:uncharacterized protein
VTGAEKCFVVDSMLGKLAKWLRILGFDTRNEHFEAQEQLDTFRAQGFFLITRKRRFSGQAGVFCPISDDPLGQLREVVSLVPVSRQEVHLLRRCVLCNEQLLEIAREQILGQVPDYVFETQTSFHRCPQCRKIYWPGSHPKRMMQRLEQELGWDMGE